MYDLLRKIIKGEKLEKIESQICSFNQLSNFHDINLLFMTDFKDGCAYQLTLEVLTVIPESMYETVPGCYCLYPTEKTPNMTFTYSR